VTAERGKPSVIPLRAILTRTIEKNGTIILHSFMQAATVRNRKTVTTGGRARIPSASMETSHCRAAQPVSES